jgi:N-ethylmaleimide reductase
VHLIEPRASLAGGGGNDAATTTAPTAAPQFRRAFRGPIISAGGYTPDSATEIVSSGLVEAVAFGRIYIANPDLPERIRARVPLNAYDRATFYGGTEKGYTDYPFMR